MNRHFLPIGLLTLLLFLSTCAEEPVQADQTATLTSTPAELPLFRLLDPQTTRIQFENALPENDQFNILSYEYYYNGGGVAIGDLNNDHLPDIVFTANLVANRVYLNEGNLTFREIAQQTGIVSRPGWKTGVTMADVNADGNLDIYICRSGNLGEAERRNELFINEGNGTFTESAAEYGLDDPGYSTHATFFDYDRDGDLDCFVLNHALKPNFNLSVAQVKGQRDPYFGDHLYRNDNGRFKDVSQSAGIIGNPIGFGLSVTVEDFDRDGWMDLFVANDYTEQDYLYHNQQNGTFKEVLDPSFGHTSHFSMGSDAGDINLDGWPDLMVLDMLPEDNFGQKILKGPDNYNKYQMQVNQGFYHQNMRNTLQLNQGRGLGTTQSFSEVGQLFGVSNTDWSWSALLADYDNDADLDLHVTNGYVRASTHLDFVKYDYPAAIRAAQEAGQTLSDGEVSKQIPTIHKPNAIFRNNGPDQGFERMNWGLDRPSWSQGAAFGDLDLDGDLDLVVNNLKAPAFVYENLTTNPSVLLKLNGPEKNPFAYGAVVEASIDGDIHRRCLIPARGFQSSVEPLIHLGTGGKTIESIRVIWPTGEVQDVPGPYEERIEVTWTNGLPAYQAVNVKRNRTLTGQTIHQENNISEFDVQPLLPQMIGRIGPCLSVLRIDEMSGELCLGGGPGQAAMLYRYEVQPDGSISWDGQELPGTEGIEVTDVIHVDVDGDSDLDLYLVAGGNDLGISAAPYQDMLLIREGNRFTKAGLPLIESSGGCVASGDPDGDGDLDLFVGGRVSPGKYPIAPVSYLLRNEGNGTFVPVEDALLEEAGMVTDAKWADLDGDGQEELIVVGEWMKVEVWQWKDGGLKNATETYGLGGSSGLWTDLEVADVDMDGDLDLLTGNMGVNAQWRVSAAEPLRMYAADFDRNGTMDPVMTYFLDGKEVPVAARDELLGQLRFLQKKFVRYESYANASIQDIFSQEELSAALNLEAKMLESGWWEQTSDGFVFHAWPLMAQSSPVLSQNVITVNGGTPQILLSGNYFPVRAETGRYDASPGFLLAHSPADDSWTCELFGHTSGIWLDGDVRDTEVIQLENDTHLVISARNASPFLWGIW